MKISAFGSGSSGNCYHVTDGKTGLLLEAGLNYKKIQRALDFKISSLSGCLVSHSHADHCKATADLLRAGIDCYMSEYTRDALGVSGHRLHRVEPEKQFTVGSWSIKPFSLQHDVPNLGYLVANGSEKLVYITDTAYCKYTFTGLTHIMVEANYSLRILDSNVSKGYLPVELRNRLVRTHFSIENVIDFIKANDMSRVEEIFLLHMSDGNGDAEQFKREIEKITGLIVRVC